jgi:hypothetical protein
VQYSGLKIRCTGFGRGPPGNALAPSQVRKKMAHDIPIFKMCKRFFRGFTDCRKIHPSNCLYSFFSTDQGNREAGCRSPDEAMIVVNSSGAPQKISSDPSISSGICPCSGS